MRPGVSWGVLGYPCVSWGVLGYPGVSWGNQTDPSLTFLFATNNAIVGRTVSQHPVYANHVIITSATERIISVSMRTI